MPNKIIDANKFLAEKQHTRIDILLMGIVLSATDLTIEAAWDLIKQCENFLAKGEKCKLPNCPKAVSPNHTSKTHPPVKSCCCEPSEEFRINFFLNNISIPDCPKEEDDLVKDYIRLKGQTAIFKAKISEKILEDPEDFVDLLFIEPDKLDEEEKVTKEKGLKELMKHF